MKKTILAFSLAMGFLFSNVANGQSELHPCGTAAGLSKWLVKYQQNPGAFPKSEQTLYVPLTIHLLGTDGGAGYFPIKKLHAAFCTLNADFEAADIQFFIEGDYNYINNSVYNNHENFSQGSQMMSEFNVANTLNCYIVASPAGNCGYAFYNLGIAVAKNCMDEDDHTWAHEIGHYLSLPHPFLGWEGIDHNYSEAAPITVNNRDVELVDGSNCTVAADGFCDTSPDYLNYRWACGDDTLSAITQTDPMGATFKSDGSLFMSYSFDVCPTRFSDEQTGAMQANLLEERFNLLYNQIPLPPIPDTTIVLTYPTDGETVNYNSVTLEWDSVPNAQSFIVQLSPIPSFGIIIHQSVVETNSVDITGLDVNRNYFWRVRPFSSFYTCTSYSQRSSFTTAGITAVHTIEGVSTIKIFPNPINADGTVHISFGSSKSLSLYLKLYSLSGKKLRTKRVEAKPGHNSISINYSGLTSGIYLLGLENEQGRIFEKIVVR